MDDAATSTSAAAVLMPMGFATLVGGMATTIGTSTNLLVVSVANDLGLERFGMFDFALPAVLAGGVAIVYLWLIAPRLLPDRNIELANASPRLFDARLHIDDSSSWIGKTLAEVKAATDGDINVVRISRGDTFVMPKGWTGIWDIRERMKKQMVQIGDPNAKPKSEPVPE